MDDISRDGDNRQGVAASPLDDLRGALLPGMEAEVLPAPVDDDIIDRLPEHSAERLLALHPDRYALATALFLGAPLLALGRCAESPESARTRSSTSFGVRSTGALPASGPSLPVLGSEC